MGIGSEITLAELEADPDPILARMRATEPVCWVPSMDMWLVTRWDDVAYMEAHPELFSAATDPSFLARALGPNMLVMDPPAHTRLRDMMLPPFQSSGRSGPFVSAELAELADGILDEIEGPTVELMGAYAQPLTAGALAIVLGLDSHGFDRMWSWCEGLVTDIANFENDPTATAIGEAAKADLGEAIAARIGQAAGGDSAIDRFVQAGATSAEIVNNVRLMISGGINEPRDGVGLVAWVLLSRPDLRQAVAVDGRRLRRLVEEVLRVHSPVGTITRQATRDLELAGAAIAAGDLVSGVLRSINLDPEHWSNPTEIDLRRREGPHAAFALGVHRCLGEWLGRQEVRVGVERLLARFPDMALVADRPVELQGFEFRGPREVWVTV
ncbi:MAG: cytochrome P450 [Acidimicrobiia bacterium]|nr:cytochrome P450 [Acidimicrobiia bacterium]MYC44032.1 cytochrome P450 [Acidimicrobiia bacterium]MYI20542.1 cytochrome P450 [Acidimicrobiia bacterium]